MTITVVGAGLAGLVAAVECAERGADVEVHEARSCVGGRARSTPGPFVANHGPHVVYQDGALWAWLDARGLAEPAGRAPLSPLALRFRFDGRVRRIPPRATWRALRVVRKQAPSGISFREWAARQTDDETAAVLSALGHVFSFHHDPGSLAADFFVERLRRVLAVPPAARYVTGGWRSLVERVVAHAEGLGVRITTGTPVTEVPPGPAILAVELAAARRLLGDDTLRWTGVRVALLDVGLTARRGDPFVVVDLDDGVFAERYTAVDPTLAPVGHDLVQLQVGLGDDEGLDEGVAQMESLLDATFTGWREREVWRRRQVVTNASGAVDLPGTTWRDRPAVDRGDGIFLCGDMVAAPGLLSEVSVASAVQAAAHAVRGTARQGALPTP